MVTTILVLTVISLLLVLMLIPVVMLMLKQDLPKYVDYGDVEVAGQEEIFSRRRQKLLNQSISLTKPEQLKDLSYCTLKYQQLQISIARTFLLIQHLKVTS